MSALVVHIAGKHIEFSPKRVSKAVAAYPRPMKFFLAVCFGLMGASVIAALMALPVGWEVLGTSPTMEWGVLIAGYVVLAITTSGLCLSISLGTVFGVKAMLPLERRGVILAFVCLVAAFVTILLDLQYPLRLVFGAVLSPSPHSAMWWMGVAYAGYLVILLVELATMYSRFHTVHKWAATAAFVMALIAPSTLGMVFGSIQAHSLWYGIWTPILMLATAFLSGLSVLAVVTSVVVRFSRRSHESMEAQTIPVVSKLLTVALIVVAFLVFRNLVVGLASDTRGLAAASRTIVSGPFSIPFWGLRVGVGILLPLFLLLTNTFNRWWPLGLAGVGSVIGVVSDRLIFVVAGLASPVSAVAGNADFPFAIYIPSLVEVMIMVGALATVVSVYVLAEHHMNLGEAEHHGDYGIMRRLRRRSEVTS